MAMSWADRIKHSFKARRAAGIVAALPLAAGVIGAAAMAAAKAPPPIVLEKQGSFSAGGTIAGDPAKASIHCDHGFVEYQIPVHPRKVSLFLWHSSSVHVWQQRWDGGEGYQSLFLRRGFPVYLWDGPRVGRANWGCEDYSYKAVQGRDQQNLTAWRFVAADSKWIPGVQFPTGDAEALNQAQRARYDEFDTPKNAELEADAAAKAIDRIGPSVLVTNSAGGWRALLAALQSDNVKAIVAYENPGYVFPEGEGQSGPAGPFGPSHVPLATFMKLTRIPIQIVWGDNIDKSAGVDGAIQALPAVRRQRECPWRPCRDAAAAGDRHQGQHPHRLCRSQQCRGGRPALGLSQEEQARFAMNAPRTIAAQADYEAYLAHFNARNYAGQIAYYARDVRYKVGTLTIDSPQAIAAFYADFHGYSSEHVALREFALTGDIMAVAVATRFEPFRDYEKHGLVFKAGEPRDIVTLAFYRLREGQIHRIRMARYGGPESDFGAG